MAEIVMICGRILKETSGEGYKYDLFIAKSAHAAGNKAPQVKLMPLAGK